MSTAIKPSAFEPSAMERVENLLHHAEEGRVQTAGKVIPWPTAFEWIFVITGGMAIFLPIILWLGEATLSRADTIRWYFWVSVIISSPHIYSTYVRQYRKIREGKSSWLLGFPTYFAAVGLLTAVSAYGFLVEAVTLINVWQSFHYLRQTYGIGCLYGGQAIYDEKDRNLRWWGYHLMFPLLIVGRWDTLYDAWGGTTNGMIPFNFDQIVLSWLYVVAAIGLYVAAFAEVRLIVRNKWKYRPTGLACFLVFLGIHYYGFMILSHYQRGFFAITIFHALQYLALVWFMERKTAISRGNKWIAAVPNIIGFAIFWALLYALGFGYEQKVTMALTHIWTQASVILLVAISVHHYIVDTFIWRRSVGA